MPGPGGREQAGDPRRRLRRDDRGVRAVPPRAGGTLRGSPSTSSAGGSAARARRGRGRHGRIEEHGLHLWMGFYENAFRLMRECYAELGRDPPRARSRTGDDAFDAGAAVGVDGAARRRPLGARGSRSFRRATALPGDRSRRAAARTVWSTTSSAGRRLVCARCSRRSHASPATTRRGPRTGRWRADALADATSLDAALGELGELGARSPRRRAWSALVAAIALAGRIDVVAAIPARASHDAAAAPARTSLIERGARPRRLEASTWTIARTRIWQLRRDRRGARPRRRQRRDPARLRRHRRVRLPRVAAAERRLAERRSTRPSCARSTISASPTRTAIRRGRASPPGRRCAACCALFFTYRGAFFWQHAGRHGRRRVRAVLRGAAAPRRALPRSSTGSRTCACALARGEPPVRRGARVRRARRRSSDRRRVRAAGRRATACRAGRPSRDWEQLVDGDAPRARGWDFESFWDRRRTRPPSRSTSGRDFDLVVLGVGLGAVPHVCRELVDARPALAGDGRAREDRRDAGVPALAHAPTWRSSAGAGRRSNISGFVEPFDTWADMRHLLRARALARRRARAARRLLLQRAAGRREPGRRARSAPTPRPPARRGAAERHRASCDAGVAHLWPARVDRPPASSAGSSSSTRRRGAARGRGALRLAVLDAPTSTRPTATSLSLPGTGRHRISPARRAYDNLTIAGDWTDCGFNAGCVEAAVMSGRLAAHALSRRAAARGHRRLHEFDLKLVFFDAAPGGCSRACGRLPRGTGRGARLRERLGRIDGRAVVKSAARRSEVRETPGAPG